MRPIRVTVGSATSSAPIPLDHYRSPFNVGIGVTLSSGANLTYTVEHTFDDVFSSSFDPATASWFPTTSLSAVSASATGNLAFPVTAVRLRVSAWVGGTATMTLIQAGGPTGA